MKTIALIVLTLSAYAEQCRTDGKWFMPLDMAGQGRTVASVAGCKQRCVDTQGCNYYNSFPDGGCHMSTGAQGTKVVPRNPTKGSGSKDCSDSAEPTNTGEISCTESRVWKTITIYKHYDFTFDIKPTGLTGGWSNIVNFTADNGYQRNSPAIWFFSNTTKMFIRQERPGAENMGCSEGPALTMGKWSKVGLKLEGSTFSVSVNDKVCCANPHYTVSDPGRTNVKVYVSDPWHHASKAKLKNLSYENAEPAIKVEAANNAALLKSTSKADSLAKQLKKAKADYATAEAGRKVAISDADKKAKAAKAKSEKAAADAKAKAAKEAAAMKAAHEKNMQASLKKQKEEDAAHAAEIAKLAAQKAKLALEKADREAAIALKVKQEAHTKNMQEKNDINKKQQKALRAKHEESMAAMKKAHQKKVANLKAQREAAKEAARKAAEEAEAHKEDLEKALLMHANAAPVAPVAPAACTTCSTGAPNVTMEQKTIINVAHSDSSDSESKQEF